MNDYYEKQRFSGVRFQPIADCWNLQNHSSSYPTCFPQTSSSRCDPAPPIKKHFFAYECQPNFLETYGHDQGNRYADVDVQRSKRAFVSPVKLETSCFLGQAEPDAQTPQLQVLPDAKSKFSLGTRKIGEQKPEVGEVNMEHAEVLEDRTVSTSALSKFRAKRPRTTFTPIQLFSLEGEFRNGEYLNRSRRVAVADSLQLTERQVKVWFQNRRMKTKRASSLIYRTQ